MNQIIFENKIGATRLPEIIERDGDDSKPNKKKKNVSSFRRLL
tara:strand:+ start:149 stop:277 length:129 start_codon:yes stop_codon:yes gene_type:complete